METRISRILLTQHRDGLQRTNQRLRLGNRRLNRLLLRRCSCVRRCGAHRTCIRTSILNWNDKRNYPLEIRHLCERNLQSESTGRTFSLDTPRLKFCLCCVRAASYSIFSLLGATLTFNDPYYCQEKIPLLRVFLRTSIVYEYVLQYVRKDNFDFSLACPSYDGRRVE